MHVKALASPAEADGNSTTESISALVVWRGKFHNLSNLLLRTSNFELILMVRLAPILGVYSVLSKRFNALRDLSVTYKYLCPYHWQHDTSGVTASSTL
jgi:hypothetical protein